jgi:hypothetical protein
MLVYILVVVNTLVVLRHFRVLVPSPPDLVDHGLTDNARVGINLLCLNELQRPVRTSFCRGLDNH